MDEHKRWAIFSLIIIVIAMLAFDQGSTKPKIAIIIIDGFSPDYFRYTPEIDALKENSNSYIISTVEPSITPAAHASIVSCQPPSVHNITDYRKSFSENPFLFRWAEKNNLHTCSVYAKSYLGFFSGSDEFYYAPLGSDMTLIGRAKEYADRCDIIIVSLPDTDSRGHAYGPESERMKSELEQIDTNIAELVNYLKSKDIKTIITSDHGMCPAPGGGGMHNISEKCALEVPLIIDKDLTIPDAIDKENMKVTDILPIICTYYNLDCTDECL